MSFPAHRRASLLGAAIALLLALPSAALAYWSATTLGATGSVGVASLSPVTGVSATAVSSTGIDVSWTTPAEPAGTVIHVYRDGAATPLACTTSPCHDTALQPATSHSYVVRADLVSWQKPAAAVSAQTLSAPAVTSIDRAGSTPVTSGSTVEPGRSPSACL